MSKMAKPELPWKSAEAICTSPAEDEFLAAVRRARYSYVGYGWMQQLIEIEWSSKTGGVGAWGPHYFESRIEELEGQINSMRDALGKKEEDRQHTEYLRAVLRAAGVLR